VPNLPTELKTSKLLVVHDVEDREVPYEHGETVAASWPGAQMHTTHGLGHRRVLNDSFVVARAIDFIAVAV
jgi:pimeloyl-ACP methyl ester carboxylesterase